MLSLCMPEISVPSADWLRIIDGRLMRAYMARGMIANFNIAAGLFFADMANATRNAWKNRRYMNACGIIPKKDSAREYAMR